MHFFLIFFHHSHVPSCQPPVLNYRDFKNALLHHTQPWLVSVSPTPAGIRSQHISFPAQFLWEAPSACSAQGRDPSITHWGPLDLKCVAQIQGKDKELIRCLPKRSFMQKPSQMVAGENRKEKYPYEHFLGHCSELLFPFQFFLSLHL